MLYADMLDMDLVSVFSGSYGAWANTAKRGQYSLVATYTDRTEIIVKNTEFL